MKKLIMVVILLFLAASTSAQTLPSWYQLRDVPSWVSDNASTVFDIRAYADEADPFAACYEDAHEIRGAVMFVDNKTYTTSASFDKPNYISIIGLSGQYTATLVSTATTTALFTLASGEGLTIENMRIYGPGTGTASIVATSTTEISGVSRGFHANANATSSGGSLSLTDVTISDFDVGLYLRGMHNYQRLEKNTVTRCRFGVLYQSNGQSGIYSPNANVFSECTINLNYHSGVWINAGVGINFNNCSIENNGNPSGSGGGTGRWPRMGFVVTGVSTVTVNGGYTENQDWVVYGASATLIVDGVWDTSARWTGVDGKLDYRSSARAPFRTQLEFGDISLYTFYNCASSSSTLFSSEVGVYYRATSTEGVGTSSVVISPDSESITSIGGGLGDGDYIQYQLIQRVQIASGDTSLEDLVYPYVYATAYSGGTVDQSSYANFIWPLLNDGKWHTYQTIGNFRFGAPYLTERISRVYARLMVKNSAYNGATTPTIVNFQRPIVYLYTTTPLAK
jgi:hypothetical protein